MAGGLPAAASGQAAGSLRQPALPLRSCWRLDRGGAGAV